MFSDSPVNSVDKKNGEVAPGVLDVCVTLKTCRTRMSMSHLVEQLVCLDSWANPHSLNFADSQSVSIASSC